MAPKRNAFFHFMVKRRKELEAEGQQFQGGWKDVAQFLNKEWMEMSLAERVQYNKGGGTLRTPSHNILEKFANGIKEREREEIFLNNKIAVCLSGDTLDKIFLLIDFNIWCVSNENMHIPAEIAIVAFSLRNGVVDQYSTLIDPGKLPIGMAYRASINIEMILLPDPPFFQPPEPFQPILAILTDFIRKYTNDRDPGYLFCRRENTIKVNSCIDWLNEHKGCPFTLYPFECLIMKMSVANTTAHLLLDMTDEDIYMYPDLLDSIILDSAMPNRRQTCCDLKESLFISEETVRDKLDSLKLGAMTCFCCLHHMRYADNSHLCALNIVNRNIYQVLDALVGSSNVCPVAGVHSPSDTPDETDKRIFMLKRWGVKDVIYKTMLTPDDRLERHQRNVEQETKMHENDVELPYTHRAPLFRKTPEFPDFIATYDDAPKATPSRSLLQSLDVNYSPPVAAKPVPPVIAKYFPAVPDKPPVVHTYLSPSGVKSFTKLTMVKSRVVKPFPLVVEEQPMSRIHVYGYDDGDDDDDEDDSDGWVFTEI